MSLKIEWWKKAVQAYGDAIDRFTQEKDAFRLAIAMAKQGNALRSIGQLERDTGKVQEAVSTLTSASAVLDPAHVPIHWASVQISLGVAYLALGKLGAKGEPLQQSMDLFETARKIFVATDATPSIARAERNLQASKVALRIQTLENAVMVAETSVKIPRPDEDLIDRARAKRRLADALFNLGEALISFGDDDRGRKRLDEAVLSYDQVLAELSEDATPLAWAETTHRRADAVANLGITLLGLGEAALGTQGITQAVDAYRKTLDKLPQKAKAPAWVEASPETHSGFLLQTFKTQFRVMMRKRAEPSEPITAAIARRNLADALLFSARTEEAIDAYRTTLAARPYRKKTIQWALIQNNLSGAEEVVASTQRDGGRKMCQALKDHVDVLNYLVLSEKSFLAGRVLEGISSVIFYQMAKLNWLPGAQARIVRSCLRDIKPQLRRNQAKLAKLQNVNNLPSAKANVGTVRLDGMCGS